MCLELILTKEEGEKGALSESLPLSMFEGTLPLIHKSGMWYCILMYCSIVLHSRTIGRTIALATVLQGVNPYTSISLETEPQVVIACYIAALWC